MFKTAIITARIDPTVKASAEQVFQSLGLTTSQAITLFYKQVELQQGLPFELKLPNQTTRSALADAQSRQNLKELASPEQLFEELGIIPQQFPDLTEFRASIKLKGEPLSETVIKERSEARY